jgi:hypothetical protein
MLLEKGGELNAVSYLQAHDRKGQHRWHGNQAGCLLRCQQLTEDEYNELTALLAEKTEKKEQV